MCELESVIIQRRSVAPGSAHPNCYTRLGEALELFDAQETEHGARALQILRPRTAAGQYGMARGIRAYTLLELLEKAIKR